MIRVLLIDDHPIVREGVRLILGQTPDIVAVGEAADGESGVRRFKDLSTRDEGVDVVVTDLNLPDISGLEVARRIKELRSTAAVLLLTMHADDEHVRGMMALGLEGYLLKQAAAQELPVAIRTVARGETFLSPRVARQLMMEIQAVQGRNQNTALLTERERQVLVLLASGETSKEIAHRLGLSAKTVDNHRARILQKLGVTNTAAAISYGYEQNLIERPR